MASADDLDDTIEELAQKPQSATGADGRSVTMPSIPDVIAAQKELAQKAGLKKAHRGLRFSKFVPPGTAD